MKEFNSENIDDPLKGVEFNEILIDKDKKNFIYSFLFFLKKVPKKISKKIKSLKNNAKSFKNLPFNRRNLKIKFSIVIVLSLAIPVATASVIFIFIETKSNNLNTQIEPSELEETNKLYEEIEKKSKYEEGPDVLDPSKLKERSIEEIDRFNNVGQYNKALILSMNSSYEMMRHYYFESAEEIMSHIQEEQLNKPDRYGYYETMLDIAEGKRDEEKIKLWREKMRNFLDINDNNDGQN